MVLWSEIEVEFFFITNELFKMAAEHGQITSNLNSNNSQTNYLYMELFHVDDSNDVSCCLPTPMTLASGGSPMFPLVVHQPASPSIWPAVQ